MTTEEDILRANTSWLPPTEADGPAIDPPAKSTTENSGLAEAVMFQQTSKLFAGNTTSSDTDSESSLTYETVSGYEDLSEVMDLDYRTILKWAALRNKAYREACETFAHVAKTHRGLDDKPAPIAECE